MHLWIQHMLIRESRAQHAFDHSPGLIAVFHALHRLLAPRYPPHALSSLAALTPPCATAAILRSPPRPKKDNSKPLADVAFRMPPIPSPPLLPKSTSIPR